MGRGTRKSEDGKRHQKQQQREEINCGTIERPFLVMRNEKLFGTRTTKAMAEWQPKKSFCDGESETKQSMKFNGKICFYPACSTASVLLSLRRLGQERNRDVVLVVVLFNLCSTQNDVTMRLSLCKLIESLFVTSFHWPAPCPPPHGK